MKINKGDFIDSRQFGREECERFIKLAVESGYTNAEGMKYYSNPMNLYALDVASTYRGRTVPYRHIGWGHIEESFYGFYNNISQQFREFLDKENSNVFTKSDLKCGMRVTHEDGTETIVVGDQLWVTHSTNYTIRSIHAKLYKYTHDLTDNLRAGFSIVKVTDRDGTVVFEREQPKNKVTLELTDEQLAAIKSQFML